MRNVGAGAGFYIPSHHHAERPDVRAGVNLTILKTTPSQKKRGLAKSRDNDKSKEE